MIALLKIIGWFGVCSLLAGAAGAQVIEFESGGLRYQTLTRDGVTIMFAHMPARIRGYGMIQVAISNGAPLSCHIGPRNFYLETPDGARMYGVPAVDVIRQFVRSASADDVIKLVMTYEAGLYGMGRLDGANGYEKRRQAAFAVVSSKRLKAAAAASAIAFIDTDISPGHSTDGAIFYYAGGRQLNNVTLKVHLNNTVFEFEPGPVLRD